MLKGIDISNWQKGIDPTALGLDFAIVKATEGIGFIDPTFTSFAAKLKAKGMLWGYYHFARENDAAKEADSFYAAVKPYLKQGIPVLDYEVWGKNSNDVAWCERFIQRFYDLTGIYCMLYISASRASQFSSSWIPKKCALWVAGYPQAYTSWPSTTCPYKAAPWSSVTIWQFTSSLRLGGYSGSLDGDYAYIDKAAWNRLAGASSGTSNSTTTTTTTKKVIQVIPIYTSGGDFYRYFNSKTGEHFITTKAEGSKLASPWKSEGKAWTVKAGGTVPIYRLKNPSNGFHMLAAYTEAAQLEKAGWIAEQVPFLAQTKGTAVYRAYNSKSGDHLFTTNKTEYEKVQKDGWKGEGVAFYV